MQPPESHRDLLERPLYASFATVGPDGSPRVNPMWFVWDDLAGRLRLTHTRTRHNYRFLQLEPRVALAIPDPDNPQRYLQVRGLVESVEEDVDARFYEGLQMRYRGHVPDNIDRLDRVVVTIEPTAFMAR